MNRIVISFFLLVLVIVTLIFATAVVTVGAIIAAAWIVGKWLDGWHIYEKAVYTENMNARHQQRELDAARELSGQLPPAVEKKPSRIAVPRR